MLEAQGDITTTIAKNEAEYEFAERHKDTAALQINLLPKMSWIRFAERQKIQLQQLIVQNEADTNLQNAKDTASNKLTAKNEADHTVVDAVSEAAAAVVPIKPLPQIDMVSQFVDNGATKVLQKVTKTPIQQVIHMITFALARQLHWKASN